MTNHKWADVAHYYANSRIMVVVHHPQSTEGPIIREIQHGDFREGYALEFRVKPILKHRDDLTEADCKVIHSIMYGDFVPTNDCKTCIDWMTTDVLQDSFTMGPLMIFIGESAVWSWLISNGFDVFGLIESGQAIRNEVQNG